MNSKQVELGRDLGAADQRDHRPLRVFERGAERLEFGLHVLAGRRRQQMRQRLDRGMRPVRRRERIIDIDIAERRQLAGEVGVVLLLARVEAQILQQRDLAGPQRIDDPLGLGSDAIGREMHGATAGRARQRLDQRAQRL